MMRWRQQALPILVTLTTLILLGYPLAFVFGLPLARQTMQDLRRWLKTTITALPPAELGAGITLSFPGTVGQGVLVRHDRPLPVPFTQEGDRLALNAPLDLSEMASLSPPLERLNERIFVLPDGQLPSEPFAVYLGSTLARQASVAAIPPPDGGRTVFSFAEAAGPLLLDDAILEEGRDYALRGDRVVFAEPPRFGAMLRRIAGDFDVLDADAGLLAFAAPPTNEVRLSTDVIRLAERLVGESDGRNRIFRFARGKIFENDRERALFVNATPLSDTAERPEERVDGERKTFTFSSNQGLVVVDGNPQEEGRDFVRDGNVITFTGAPPRNGQLRQYRDFYVFDPVGGLLQLAETPPAGAIVWAKRYTVYDRPGCGTTLLECFYALPQHPVPFPHWIAQRILPFFGKFPITDERNVIRATLYTTLGTLAALALGGAVGIVLAVLFVLFRPLERALLPWTVASQTVPIIALVPVMLLILGNFGITIQTSLLPTAIIGAYISFFPVVVSTVKGLRSVDPLALDLMRSYAASPLQVFTKVRFPAAVPFFFTSLKLGAAAALVGALVAETESNNRRGLGFQILGQVQSGNVADVWILLLVSGLLGIGLVGAVGLLQRLIAPWERT